MGRGRDAGEQQATRERSLGQLDFLEFFATNPTSQSDKEAAFGPSMLDPLCQASGTNETKRL